MPYSHAHSTESEAFSKSSNGCCLKKYGGVLAATSLGFVLWWEVKRQMATHSAKDRIEVLTHFFVGGIKRKMGDWILQHPKLDTIPPGNKDLSGNCFHLNVF